MSAFHISGVNRPPEQVDGIAKSDVALSPELAHLHLTEDEPASSVESTETTMADNGQNVVATPYPFYATGGNDSDEVFKAALITQGDASTQRNQDSQFAALRDQQLNRDVVDNQRAVENAKFELATAQKDSEIRSVDRFAEIKSELAAMREKMDGNAIAQLRVDLAETKADARAQKQESLLAAILAKLPV
jgi:hypothetical protein